MLGVILEASELYGYLYSSYPYRALYSHNVPVHSVSD
jgi:hypothetical protein